MTMALVAAAKPSDADFLTLFNRLAIALRGEADNFGVTVEIYYDALADLPMAALEQGALDLMKQPGRKFFPTTPEWREAAELAQQRQLREAVQPDPTTDRAMFICRDCHDTGWVLGPGGGPLDCAGDKRCGRHQPHAPHSYTLVCPCRATNANWIRTQHFGAGR
jgi:hypothetical protein